MVVRATSECGSFRRHVSDLTVCGLSVCAEVHHVSAGRWEPAETSIEIDRLEMADPDEFEGWFDFRPAVRVGEELPAKLAEYVMDRYGEVIEDAVWEEAR